MVESKLSGRLEKIQTELEVEEKTLKFSIPESVKPGRYGLAILTKDNRMVDQPVRLTVE